MEHLDNLQCGLILISEGIETAEEFYKNLNIDNDTILLVLKLFEKVVTNIENNGDISQNSIQQIIEVTRALIEIAIEEEKQ